MLEKKNIAEWLEKSGHSRKWLARKCSVSAKTIGNWITSDTANIPAHQRARIAELMRLEKVRKTAVLLEFDRETFERIEKKSRSEDVLIHDFCEQAIIDKI